MKAAAAALVIAPGGVALVDGAGLVLVQQLQGLEGRSLLDGCHAHQLGGEEVMSFLLQLSVLLAEGPVSLAQGLLRRLNGLLRLSQCDLTILGQLEILAAAGLGCSAGLVDLHQRNAGADGTQKKQQDDAAQRRRHRALRA